jgi:hypothetical protein
MKRHVMFSALFIAAFLCSSLGSVLFVQYVAAIACDGISRNNQKELEG